MDPANAILMIVALILAISFHESAHAYIADRCGDPTARNAGRISMNPIDHIDPFWTVLLPGLMLFAGLPPIGAAKPVPVNPSNLRNPTRDRALVAAAGPLTNILLALIGVVLAVALAPWLHAGSLPAGEAIGKLLLFTTLINTLLAVFNLLPIPPLDGSGILQYFLSPSQAQWLRQNRNMLLLIFLLLWIMGLLGVILSPFVNAVLLFEQFLMLQIWGPEVTNQVMGLLAAVG